jgi:NifU-like protein involved in Fe-S cluster formation
MIDELYSLKILKLAAHMPRSGRLSAPDGSGERVAKLCGSKAVVDVKLADGRIADYAQEIQACALGQAAAAILGEHAIGATPADVEAARDQLKAMLKDGGSAPTGRFAGLADLEQVRDYPARHASTLVAFEAAVDALHQAQDSQSSGATPRTSTADAA